MKTLLLLLALTITARAAETIRVIGYVLSKTPEGLLVTCKAAPRAIGVKRASGAVFLKGHPQQATIVDKAPINCLATVTGIFEYTTVLKAHATVQELTFEK